MGFWTRRYFGSGGLTDWRQADFQEIKRKDFLKQQRNARIDRQMAEAAARQKAVRAATREQQAAARQAARARGERAGLTDAQTKTMLILIVVALLAILAATGAHSQTNYSGHQACVPDHY